MCPLPVPWPGGLAPVAGREVSRLTGEIGKIRLRDMRPIHRLAPCRLMSTPPAPDGPGFVVLYRWRLHSGLESSFIEAWSQVSALLRSERGSLGSRLHCASDGLWYSYAQWPSAQTRQDAFALGPVDVQATEAMEHAIAERFPEIILEPVADLIVPTQNGA